MSNQTSNNVVRYCSKGCEGHITAREVCTEYGVMLDYSLDELENFEPSHAELAMSPKSEHTIVLEEFEIPF